MELNLQIIADQLEDWRPALLGVRETGLDLGTPRLWPAAGGALEAAHLYIATAEQLAGWPPPDFPLRLVCLGAKARVAEATRGWQAACVCLEGGQDAATVFNRVCAVFDHFEAINTALLTAISNGEPLEACLAIAARFFGNPMLLLDTAYTTIAVAKAVDGRHIDEEKWFSTIRHGHVEIKTFNRIVERRKTSPDFNKKSVFGSLWPEVYNGISAQVAVGGQHAANLFIPDDFVRMQPGHLALADYLVGWLAVLLQREKQNKGVQSSLMAQFVSNLLAGMAADDETVRFFLAQNHWRPQDSYTLLCVAPQPAAPLEHFDLKLIRNFFAECFYLNHEDHSLFIINCGPGGEPPADALARLEAFLTERGMRGSLSLPFERFALLPAHYQLVLEALRAGGDKSLHRVQDSLPRQMVALWNRQLDARALCHPQAMKLHAYDARHNTDFLRSLYAYLRHERSLLKAAAALHIHRNTLVYRLERIADVIRVDYDDPAFRQHVLLSCMILWEGVA